MQWEVARLYINAEHTLPLLLFQLAVLSEHEDIARQLLKASTEADLLERAIFRMPQPSSHVRHKISMMM